MYVCQKGNKVMSIFRNITLLLALLSGTTSNSFAAAAAGAGDPSARPRADSRRTPSAPITGGDAVSPPSFWGTSRPNRTDMEDPTGVTYAPTTPGLQEMIATMASLPPGTITTIQDFSKLPPHVQDAIMAQASTLSTATHGPRASLPAPNRAHGPTAVRRGTAPAAAPSPQRDFLLYLAPRF